MQFLDGNCGVVSPGAILSEEELAAMSPTAAAVAKVVKPGMKLTEVSEHNLSSSKALGCHNDTVRTERFSLGALFGFAIMLDEGKEVLLEADFSC